MLFACPRDSTLDSSLENRREKESTNLGSGSGGKQIDDVLNGIVGAVVGGFEFADRVVMDIGAVVKAAVGEGSAEAFVEEQKE